MSIGGRRHRTCGSNSLSPIAGEVDLCYPGFLVGTPPGVSSLGVIQPTTRWTTSPTATTVTAAVQWPVWTTRVPSAPTPVIVAAHHFFLLA